MLIKSVESFYKLVNHKHKEFYDRFLIKEGKIFKDELLQLELLYNNYVPPLIFFFERRSVSVAAL